MVAPFALGVVALGRQQVDAADRVCPDCGSELVSIGQKLIRQELHYIPAKLSIQNIYAESYECRPCRKAGKVHFFIATLGFSGYP